MEIGMIGLGRMGGQYDRAAFERRSPCGGLCSALGSIFGIIRGNNPTRQGDRMFVIS